MGCRKKRRPSCNGADTGFNVTRHESEPTSDGSFSARERAESSWKGREQREALDAGALPIWQKDWKVIKWPAIFKKIRRLQVRIAEAVRADTKKLYTTQAFESGVSEGSESLKSFVIRRRAFLLQEK